MKPLAGVLGIVINSDAKLTCCSTVSASHRDRALVNLFVHNIVRNTCHLCH